MATLRKRVIGLDEHQAQITACALIEEADDTTRIEQRQAYVLLHGEEREEKQTAFVTPALP